MCFIGQRLSDNFVILQFFCHHHNTDIPVSIPTYFSKTASNYKLRFLSKLLSKIELAVLLYLEDPSENNTKALWLESKNVDEASSGQDVRDHGKDGDDRNEVGFRNFWTRLDRHATHHGTSLFWSIWILDNFRYKAAVSTSMVQSSWSIAHMKA